MSFAVAQQGRSFRIEDLDQFPEGDGFRYQLLEGSLVVSPAPTQLHQRMVTRLLQLLAANCPPELEVLAGPVDVVLADDTVLEPDLLVVARETVRATRRAEQAPLLVVEVLSRSTRMFDLTAKRAAYRAGGVAQYWIADPVEPSLHVITWSEGEETEQLVTGEEVLTTDGPFAVDLCPHDLVRD